MSITVRELLTRLGVDADTATVQRFDGAVRKVKGSLLQAAKGAQTASVATGSLLADGVKRAAAGAVNVAGAMLQANIESERLFAALVTVTGGVNTASEAMGTLTKFAASTPFEIAEVVDAFIKLKARGLDPSERALTSYGNTASAMGKSLDQFIEAVADATTGEFERLKEFGLKASSEGKKVTFTFKGVKTTIGKNAKEIEDFLINLGEQNFAGGMERQSKTLGGAISNLQDFFFNLFVQIGKGGVNDALKETIFIITGTRRESFSLGKTIGVMLAFAIRRVNDLLRVLAPHLKLIAGLMAAVGVAAGLMGLARLASMVRILAARFALLARTMLPLIARMLLVLVPLILIGLALEDIVTFARGGDSVIGRILGDGAIAQQFRSDLLLVGEALKELFSVLGSLVGELFTELSKVITPGELIAGFLRGVIFLVALVLQGLILIIKGVAFTIAALVRFFGPDGPFVAAWRATLDFLSRLWSAFADFVIAVFGPVVEFFVGVGVGLGRIFVAALRIIVALFGAAFGLIAETFAPLADWFQVNVIDPLIEAFSAFGEFMVEDVFGVILDIVQAIVDLLHDLIDLADEALGTITDIGETVFGGIADVGSSAFDLASDAGSSIVGGAEDAADAIDGFFGEDEPPSQAEVQAQLASVAAGTATFGGLLPTSQAVNVGAVTVNVEGSTDMDEGALKRATQSGVQSAGSTTLREAERAFGGGGFIGGLP